MKIIRVEKCTRCPSLVQNDFKTSTWDIFWYCGRSNKYLGKTIDEVPDTIPEWCPLEEL